MKFSLTIILVLLLITSCSNKKETTESTSSETTTVAQDDTPRPDVAVGDTVYLDSGVKYVFLKRNDGGAPVEAGKTVTTHINLAANGIDVWSTREPLKPFAFVAKQTSLIQGFDEVIMYVQQGDRIMAVIPSELGYGPSGNGNIPPNALLHFDIEILNVR